MKTFMAFPLCSLLFIILVAIVYFNKPRIKSYENEIYQWLIICNIIGLILEILCYFAVDYVTIYNLISIAILKLYVVYIFVWTMIFNIYVFMVSSKNYNQSVSTNEIYFLKLKKYTKICTFILSIIMVFLPIKIFDKGNIAYTYGPIVNMLLVLCIIIVFIWFIKCIMNFKKLKQKKYFPIIACIIILTLVFLIQSSDRSILIATTGHSFIVLLMYFTIENPDVKLLEEREKNRLLLYHTIEEKSNFLFIVSSNLRNTIKKIYNVSLKSLNNDDKNQLKKALKEINNDVNYLNFSLENILNVSNMDIKNIKIVENKYNFKNMIEKIKLLKEKEISNEIDFYVNISNVIPEYMYGDKNSIEQVLNSLLNNAIKNTKNGFIELRVNCIVKYDMCRLIITIEDSGKGISVDVVNKLLEIDEELSNEELERLDTNDININTIKKIIKKMGGYFVIKSEIDKGTEVKIVIDQKIDLINKTNIINDQDNRILIVSDNMNLVNSLNKYLLNKNYFIETSIYGKDVLERMRIGEKYKYIIIDDNIDTRALPLLQKLKKNKKFKIPVIIILDKETEFIKKHFIKDGFSDYILSYDLKK